MAEVAQRDRCGKWLAPPPTHFPVGRGGDERVRVRRRLGFRPVVTMLRALVDSLRGARRRRAAFAASLTGSSSRSASKDAHAAAAQRARRSQAQPTRSCRPAAAYDPSMIGCTASSRNERAVPTSSSRRLRQPSASSAASRSSSMSEPARDSWRRFPTRPLQRSSSLVRRRRRTRAPSSLDARGLRARVDATKPSHGRCCSRSASGARSDRLRRGGGRAEAPEQVGQQRDGLRALAASTSAARASIPPQVAACGRTSRGAASCCALHRRLRRRLTISWTAARATCRVRKKDLLAQGGWRPEEARHGEHGAVQCATSPARRRQRH